MALFFRKLPGEIRNQIYRELLLDVEEPLEPQSKSFKENTPSKRLHPVILRVCKRTEKEALPILYQENIFRFDYRWPCYKYGRNTLFSPGIHLGRGWKDMRKVIVAFREKKHQHLCAEAKETMVMFKFFNKLGCSFDTLKLAFTFDRLDHDDDNGISDFLSKEGSTQKGLRAAAIILSSGTLLKAIAQLEVRTRVEIAIDSDYEEDCGLSDKFAYGVGSMKQWAVTMRDESEQIKTTRKQERDDDDEITIGAYSPPDSTEDQLDGVEDYFGKADPEEEAMNSYHCTYAKYAFRDLDYEGDDTSDRPRYAWTWTLKPATTAGRGKFETY